MKEKEQSIKYIVEHIKSLPKELQWAICWAIENIELVNQLTEGEKMTEIEIEKFTQTALEKKDYIMLVIVLYKQRKDQCETEDK